MGIRCYCPNGHKLNVKAEQAGMVGICPKCGARFQIPFESTRPSRSHKEEPSSSAEENASLVQNPHTPADQSRPDSHGAEPAAPAEPAAAKAPAAAQLQDDNSESWYIQGGDNREYGPVTLEVIRSWIAEHRVAAATLVWKKGWPDWKEARLVFSEFSASPPPPPAAERAPAQTGNTPSDEIDALRQAAQNSRETLIRKKSRLAKKQKSQRDLYIVITLLATILILAGVLLFLLLRNSGKEESSAPPAAAVSAAEPLPAPDGFLQS